MLYFILRKTDVVIFYYNTDIQLVTIFIIQVFTYIQTLYYQYSIYIELTLYFCIVLYYKQHSRNVEGKITLVYVPSDHNPKFGNDTMFLIRTPYP